MKWRRVTREEALDAGAPGLEDWVQVMPDDEKMKRGGMITVTIWYEELVNGSLIKHRETVMCDEIHWQGGSLACYKRVAGDPSFFQVQRVYAPGVWKRVLAEVETVK